MFSLHKTVKGKPPLLPFLGMKEAVLGKEYDLSIIFIGSARSQTLNKRYRGKDRPANILSFPITSDEGEIFIDLKEAKRSAKDFDRSFESFIGFLFIHGLYHLKGYEHSSKMEDKEAIVRKKFNL